MAGKKRPFTVNTRRFDPYKNFKFRVAIGAVVSAIAGIFMLKKLLPGASQNAKDYQTPTPSNDPGRPIQPIGTSTARGSRAKSKARTVGKTAKPRGRKSPGIKRTRRAKPR